MNNISYSINLDRLLFVFEKEKYTWGLKAVGAF